MLSYLNPMPLVHYFKKPSTETAQAAIDFLSHSGEGLTSIAYKAQFVFAGTLTLALLMYSRSNMIEDERAYSSESRNDLPVSPLYVFSRFFFCIALLSGFSYINCKGGSFLTNQAVSWIKASQQ